MADKKLPSNARMALYAALGIGLTLTARATLNGPPKPPTHPLTAREIAYYDAGLIKVREAEAWMVCMRKGLPRAYCVERVYGR